MANQQDNGKKKSPVVPILGALVLILAAALVAVLVGGNGSGGEESTVPQETAPAATEAPTTVPEELTLEIESVEEQGDRVVVNTSYAVVQYPFAFSDLIRVQAVNGEADAALKITALLGEAAYPVYTIHFGGSGDILLGTLTLKSGETVSVYGTFDQIPQELTEADTVTFYAVQETFNDVVASLGENAQFTPAS